MDLLKSKRRFTRRGYGACTGVQGVWPSGATGSDDSHPIVGGDATPDEELPAAEGGVA
jgi:hypothetical protein